MSRKASPPYFKSRMLTFFNPMFLGGIIIFALLGVAGWQFLSKPNQITDSNNNFNNVELDQSNNQQINNINPNNSNSNNPTENPNVINTQQPNLAGVSPTSSQQQQVSDDILSNTTTGTSILNPITDSGNELGDNSNRKLREQLSQLPNLFPELLPNQGSSTADPLYNPNQTSVSNDYRFRNQTDFSRINNQTPLAAAVNRVMQNNNYSSSTGQFRQSVPPSTPSAINNQPIAPAQSYGTSQGYGSAGAYSQTPNYNTGYSNAPASPTQSYGTSPTYNSTPSYNPSYNSQVPANYGNLGYGAQQNYGTVPPSGAGVNQSPFGNGY